MNLRHWAQRPAMAGWAIIWTALIVVPLCSLLVQMRLSPDEILPASRIVVLLFHSVALSATIALVSVVLGFLPGRALGAARGGRGLFLLLILLSMALPRYVMYYAWSLLLSPTTFLGRMTATRMDLARAAGWITASGTLALWYWPVAAVILSQGWRQMNQDWIDSARLETGRWGVWRHILLPLLIGPMGLAFMVCFVLALSEFTTFHLAGVNTIGTELALLYDLTGTESCPVEFAAPAALIALGAAFGVRRGSKCWNPVGLASWRPVAALFCDRLILFLLVLISLGVPVVLLVVSIRSREPFVQFLTLHSDDILYSLGVGVATALLAYIVAQGAVHLEGMGKGSRWLGIIAQTSLLLLMFLPASLPAVAVLRVLGSHPLLAAIRESPWVVSLGQAGHFAGFALILLLLLRGSSGQSPVEAARLDGASVWQRWKWIHFPRTWPAVLSVFILITMFSMTEIAAAMVLLPAGAASFSQRLLNQMHYVRDQQVIASCLILIGLFGLLTIGVVGLLRLTALRRLALCFCLGITLLGSSGCEESGSHRPARVVNSFGRTGRGPCEFAYPRVIEITEKEELYVCDKTGRIQRFTGEGVLLGSFTMPQIETGLPVGMSMGPDGNLYVADTHYHRVMVFTPNGQILREFGAFGETDGCFIYPTDIAFDRDGRIFVSEYGGNDRISVFTPEGHFLFCFGEFGDGQGQFSRPNALCMDPGNDVLYIVDSCNHRIAVYTPQGNLIRYLGAVGREPGQFRYPYDLTLMNDGTLVVCEYGNNRIQLLDSNGGCRRIYGGPGREPGQLAYPWGVVVDRRDRAYIVDAGNDRIQVWQL
ncbi:MAG: hypothetical protein JW828_07390 [Sedimentisphaerales bacterium]|nr:hypothetical protein [Sedimentisphaerales bacterium]